MKRTLLALVPAMLSPAAFADEPGRFTAEDVFELEYAGDPRISPDGSRIVYERRSNDIMNDGTRSNLWIIAGRPSRLVAKVDNILAWFARYRTDLDDDDE